MRGSPGRRRGAAVLLLVGAIGVGLGVHYLADGAVSDIAGDVLYAIAAYLAVVMIAPRLSPVVTGAIALAWCVAIELFQLTGIPVRLGEAFPPATLVLGTGFDGRDIAVYAVAVLVAASVDAGIRRRLRGSVRQRGGEVR